MEVTISRKAEKQIKKLPKQIVTRLLVWIETIESEGIESIRTIPGFNDEALSGKRTGQRSSRLNKAYRVIYTESGEIIEVLEVNKHDY